MFDQIVFGAIALIRLCAPLGLPGEQLTTDDRASIETVVRARVLGLNRAEDRPIWSEVTERMLLVDSVWLIAPDTAIVKGSVNRYGSLILKESTPLTLLVRREAGEWHYDSQLYLSCGASGLR
jgi:hypothetical protein